ncbi:MAG: peptidase M16 [Nitrosomonadales bacterium]|nr:peptidase M16 [Nitrosomonadales bacterium]|tara:strand:- start:1045 stop:2337 length:1293 start_codon:yes stop_codon:yes gene_type:complete
MFIKVILISILLIFSNLTFAKLNIQFWKTDNGARVYFIENHDLPILDINVDFRAGSVKDTKQKNGLASLTNHMMVLGSGGINEEDLANKFIDLGAQLDSSFDQDKSGFSLRTLSDKKSEAVDLMRLVLHEPNFDSSILEREKKRYIASINQAKTMPSSIASKAFMKALYGKHPYGLPSSGEVESIKKIRKKDLHTFYKNHYLSNELSIVIVGDVSRKNAEDLGNKISLGFSERKINAEIPSVDYVKGQEIEISHPAKQAHLYYGAPIIKRGDPDFLTLYLGNYILGGGGFVSRLTQEIREDRGLAYSVYSYFMPFIEAGPFQIGIQTKKSQVKQAKELIQKTVADFIKNGPTSNELRRAKDFMIGGFPLRLDSNKKILEYVSMMAFYKYPLDYLETFTRKIDKITAEEIKSAFQRRVDMTKFSTVIVGSE